MIKLYNTLTRKKESFKPIKDKSAGLYTCGPTVYWYAHIGNLRTYIFEDILKKTLKYNKYKIKHVMNITDVGHLTSDSDTGEDKMEKGAKREKKTAEEIADFYTKAFKEDIKKLNIERADILPKATETIKDQINLIKELEKKGYTYKIEDGVYFDTSKIKDYGKLTGSKKRKLKEGARVAKVKGKRNPRDFALWKLTPKGAKRQMEWDSPWGKGFPGWHTECVAMSLKHLGIPFDIHCGGIDHIPIHHTNEIAQAEALYKKNLANYWLHGEFLILKKGRMGKSEGNIITLNDLTEKGFNPLAYRYLCLGTHYRKKLTFSWKTLKGAQNALDNLYQKFSEIEGSSKKINKKYQKEFNQLISDDLNIPKALALMWNLIKDKKTENKKGTLLEFDKIFGLNLKEIKPVKIPKEIRELVKEREKQRKDKNWKEADKTREKINKLGYAIEDTKEGSIIKKNIADKQ